MRKAKLKLVDVKARGPLSKERLLGLIKRELDREFPTDVVHNSKITITCNREDTGPPCEPKKAKK